MTEKSPDSSDQNHPGNDFDFTGPFRKVLIYAIFGCACLVTLYGLFRGIVFILRVTGYTGVDPDWFIPTW